MKKIVCLFLMAICLFTGCSQSNGPEAKACLEHVGNLECENCGLNYYDELKSIITSNGRQGGTAGSIVYDGEKHGRTSTYVIYDASDSDIKISVEYDLGSLGTQNYLITIPHPSNGDAIKDCKYTWILGSGTGATAIGLLNAKTFSSYTSSLTETVYNGYHSAVIDSVRSSSAAYAKDGINYALIPLLKLGTKGLTVANFGFINF